MGNIKKVLIYLLIIFVLLGVGGYYYHKKAENKVPESNTPEDNTSQTTPVNIDTEEEFVTKIKEIYNLATADWISKAFSEVEETAYCNVDGCEKVLSNTPDKYIYYIAINSQGKVIKYYVVNGTFQYTYLGEELLLDNITDIKKSSELTQEELILISSRM